VLLAELLDKLKGLYCAGGLQSLDLKEVKCRATRCVLNARGVAELTGCPFEYVAVVVEV
jgi:hypothetical protein